MKQKIYNFGIISAIVLLIGTMLKVEHWPGAQVMLCLGTLLLLFLFLPAALINHFRINGNKQNKLLYIVTYLTCFVVFTSMLFKINHWPFTGYLILIAVPFPFVVFLPVWLAVTSRIKNFDINNTTYVLLFLALQSVFSVLLALNVTRETLYNTMKLDAQVISLNDKIENSLAVPEKSAIAHSADAVLARIEECRNLLYGQFDLSADSIKAGSYDTRYLTDIDMPAILLMSSSDPSPATKLSSALDNFLAEIGKLPESEEVVKNAKNIFELNEVPGADNRWQFRMFQTRYLTWYLVELDGMENFVRIIKTSILD